MNQDKKEQFGQDLADLEKDLAELKHLTADLKKPDQPTLKESFRIAIFIVPIFLVVAYTLHKLFPTMRSYTIRGDTDILILAGGFLALILYGWLYPKYLRKRANIRLQRTGYPGGLHKNDRNPRL